MSKLNTFTDAARAARQVPMIPVYLFDGNPMQLQAGNPVVVRASILAQVFGLERFVLLKADKPESEDFDMQRWRATLEYVLGNGVMHQGKRFKVVGASSSLKDGKFWLAEESLIPEIHKYFKSAQEALVYFGILTSGCHQGIRQLDTPIKLVEDGELGTGDGFGFVPIRLLRQLNLPEKQIQVRFVGATWLGKGTLHPYDGDELILPDSIIKGAGRPDDQPYYFGVRDVAEVRRFRSNFTVSQWFSHEVHSQLREVVDRKLEVIRQTFESAATALTFLGLVARWSDDSGNYIDSEARTTLEAFLKAGLSPKHRWIHQHLKRLTRKAYVELASGGGIELSGRMMAFARLPEDTVCIPDLPRGKVMVSRYPIRDKASFVVVNNAPDAGHGAKDGSIYMNEILARQLDGDFDGDYAIVCSQEAVIAALDSPAWLDGYQRVDVPAKQRKADPLHLLPYVATESLGNSIGYLTYLIAGCVAEGKSEYVADLSAQLQSEVQKLKWDTRCDWDKVKRVEERVKIPDYLGQLKSDKQLFVREAPALDYNHCVAVNYNYVAGAWAENESSPQPLLNFRHKLPLWSHEAVPMLMPEAKAVVSYYNNWISRILENNPEPDEAEIQPPLEFLKSWAASKNLEREAWAIAVWNVVHESRSESSSGSAAFHAFPDETLKLLQQEQGGCLQIRPANGRSASNSGEVFHFNGRSYHRFLSEQLQQCPLKRDMQTAETHVIPVVGGWHMQPGDSKRQQLERFRERIGDTSATATVQTLKVDGRIMFYADDLCLGQIAKDSIYHGLLPEDLKFQAQYLLKGQTVYLMLSAEGNETNNEVSGCAC